MDAPAASEVQGACNVETPRVRIGWVNREVVLRDIVREVRVGTGLQNTPKVMWSDFAHTGGSYGET